MKKKNFKWPDFDKMSYGEEAKWWDKHDFTEFWDELEDVDMAVDLKRSKEEALVVRLQKDFKERLKQIAYQKGLNVSTLARMWLLERLRMTK